jgi:uncharacterized protein YrrD
MLIEAKKLIGLPIAALDVASKIAEIQKILVDPNSGNVLGFLVSAGGLFSPKKIVSAVDVREWDPNGLITDSVENLVDPKEIVRVKEVLDQKIDLFGMKAKTKKGKNLGNIEDFLIDTATTTVMKYYIKDLVLKSRVFPSDKVIKIEKGTVIFDDDLAEMPSDAAGVPA